MKNKQQLKRIDFDTYILFCMNEYTRSRENDFETEYGKILSDGYEFANSDATNRNPTQVPGSMWKRLLYKHIRKFSYN